MFESVSITRTQISAELNNTLYASGYKWFVKGNLHDFFNDSTCQVYDYDYIYFKDEENAKSYCTLQNEKFFEQLWFPTIVYKTEIAENYIDLSEKYFKQLKKARQHQKINK